MKKYKWKKAKDLFVFSVCISTFSFLLYVLKLEKISFLEYIGFLIIWSLLYIGMFHELYISNIKKEKKSNYSICMGTLKTIEKTLPPFMKTNLGWIEEDVILVESMKNYFKNAKAVDNITLTNTTVLERIVKNKSKT